MGLEIWLLARSVAYWAPMCVWAAVILFFSSLAHLEDYFPLSTFGQGIFQSVDKCFHAIEYGVLAVLCYRTYYNAAGRWAAQHASFLALMSSGTYGMANEIHQYFIPTRSAELADVFADVAGTYVALVIWRQTMQ
jgi:VanZ family protein